MDDALLLLCAPASVVNIGVPECWVDARRVARWLRRDAANDNSHSTLLVPGPDGPLLATTALPAAPDNRDGGTRPQHVDLLLANDDVCFIHRDGYRDPDADRDAADLIVASQCNGPPGMVRLRWEPRLERFESFPEDESHG